VSEERGWPEVEDRKFYIQRGVPLVPMATLVVVVGVQTILGVRYISGLEAEVTAQGRGQISMNSKLEKVEVKLDAVAGAVQQSNVPAALNQRAIADIERQITALALRVAECERMASERRRER
jgi:hypothetical protein